MVILKPSKLIKVDSQAEEKSRKRKFQQKKWDTVDRMLGLPVEN